MKSILSRRKIGIVLAGILLFGCADIAGRVTDRALDRAGDKIAEEITRRVLTPFRQAFIRTSFIISFYGYGAPLVADAHPYQEGEWTEWEVRTTGDKEKEAATNIAWIKKGLVKKTSGGDEWWSLEVRGEEADEVYLYEALFMPQHKALLRLLAQFPGESPEEVPIDTEDVYPDEEEGEGTEESPVSVNADMEKVTIEVPAGKFQVQKFSYSGATEEGDKWEVDFFISDQIPGGLVAYEVRDTTRIIEEDGNERTVEGSHRLELKAYGKGIQLRLLPQMK